MKIIFLIIMVFSELYGSNSVIDKQSKLIWQDDKFNNVKRNWDDANQYCQNLSLYGYKNWRLPTIKEFILIVDIKEQDGMKKGFKTIRGKFWCLNEDSLYLDHAWFMYFGRVFSEEKMNLNDVICVRDYKE
jgi:hypothetical protein